MEVVFMSDMSVKQQVLQTLENLPENADIESMMYELYVIENIKKGQDDIQNLQLVTTDELQKQIQQW